MTMTSQSTPADLETIYYEMSLEADIPDANLIDAYVKRYPQFSVEITDFAIALTLDALAPEEEESECYPEEVSPSVSRAMSHFQNLLYKAREGTKGTDLETKLADQPGPETYNPIAALSTVALKDFAQRLGANGVFVIKLRDRQIDPTTIPPGFISHAANSLPSSDVDFIAHIMAAPAAQGQSVQFHKADGKPDHGEQESFVDAIKNSGLIPKQQDHLLGL